MFRLICFRISMPEYCRIMIVAVLLALAALANTADAAKTPCNSGCSSSYYFKDSTFFYCCANSTLSTTSAACVATDSEPLPGPYSDDACTRNGTFDGTAENGYCGVGHTCKAFPTAGYTAAYPYNNILVSSITGNKVPSTLYCCSRTLNGGITTNISFAFTDVKTPSGAFVNGILAAYCVNSSGLPSMAPYTMAPYSSNSCSVNAGFPYKLPNASTRTAALSTAAAAFAGFIMLLALLVI